MQTSKLSTKGQITIPIGLRNAIGIEPGDLVAYSLKGNTLEIRRIDPLDAIYHASVSETLEEWSSPEDDEAFNDL